ncbi:VPS10 domain-containing protein [Eilatimonas milleporae]|uniref:Photosystem II stability/assembly factor-like uncharacterized protein n=1 Tax=Eilatimonas milleporae TaxID=911205 RepID=A0A3M0CEA9_9PROT|nr:glycosyl hydrolase [Eilatimonas milleporae]RMB08151.1 photosystem II stability/assembly factor-like uncharacterized protein [Eilatimonas milleporae]
MSAFGGMRLLAAGLCIIGAVLTAGVDTVAQDGGNPFAGLKPRLIGPSYSSGRISDFAFHPTQRNVFYVATASAGVWKTDNAGISWTPLFDGEASYATGVITMDPADPLTLWVGTGENNSQRSVANGDGVYKSTDGGKSWKNMGLKDSGHISRIWVHPDDSDVVLVAAQGPLWSGGGDRGLYKTTDGGATWTRILEIDADTGVNEFVVDPRNPDVIVASSYQRRRHVWTLINGGPGSGVHRTTDGGATWTKVTRGLPTQDHLGRIGLAGAPSAPGMIYAIVETEGKGSGLYRSTDFGQSWEKRSGHRTTSAQYYNELIVDPHDADTLYAPDTFTQVSRDGGKTFSRLGFESRHVDDHALWIDPDNTSHLYIGGDGGIYESWDGGTLWRHVNNLPIVQFYRIQPDEDVPFYNVCGGTQDNNSLCGPSRTAVAHGITNSDWHIVLGGDGYKPQIDPTDPNIIYAQYQYGGLARYDRRTQERIYITPQPDSGENEYKWNWNTPLLISPHNPRRLFYAAEKVFVSDDRGDTWRIVSPDLTRRLDRNGLEVMGRVWSVDSVAKNDSTSMYGSIIALNESPLREGLIYVGTDDGLIHVTEDFGENWRTVDSFRGVPDMSLVEDIIASPTDENVAYAVIDNHKRGDFKPYVLKTTDKGRRWRLISGDLPARGSAHTIAEDHVDPDLLFVGTEYGLFFTQNGGENWTPVKSGFPTIAVRDLEIQRRENDLVVGTFGRGAYVIDDYRPLRTKAADLAGSSATLFAVRDPWLYVEGNLWGGGKKGNLGDQFWQVDNPPYGAVFTYYLNADLTTARDARRKAEQEIEKQGGDTPYPSFDTLRQEDREEAPAIILTVRDASGTVVRRIKGATKKGLHRTAWDLRHEAPDKVELNAGFRPPWAGEPEGPMATPGTYTVEIAQRVRGVLEPLAGPQRFMVKPLVRSPETTDDFAGLLAFQQKTADLSRALDGALGVTGEMDSRIAHLKVALMRTPAANEDHETRLRAMETRLADINVRLRGDRTVSGRNEPAPWSIRQRVNSIFGHWGSQAPVPGVHARAYRIAAAEFAATLADIRTLGADLAAFEAEAGAAGAPWTPGRLPDWSPE